MARSMLGPQDFRQVQPMSEEEVLMHESNLPPLPGHKKHTCTDVCWIPVILSAVAFLLLIVHYAWRHGDLRRLSHGFDHLGRLCGVDVEGDYAYWCRVDPARDQQVEFPVCLVSCPTSNLTMTKCYDATQQQEVIIRDFPSMPFAKLCIPTVLEQQRQEQAEELAETQSSNSIFNALFVKDNSGLHFSPSKELMSQARLKAVQELFSGVLDVWRAWPAYGVTIAVTTSLSFLYLILLSQCAEFLCYVCLMVLMTTPTVSGAYLIRYAVTGSSGPIRGTGEAFQDLLLGSFLILVGLVVACVACYAARGIKMASGVISAACECIFQEWSVIYEPFVSVIWKASLSLSLLAGFILLLSCGEVHSTGQRGVGRSFTYKPVEIVFIVSYCFISLWLLEFSTALSQYVLAWVAQRWYFCPYVDGVKVGKPRCPVIRGLCNALGFHFGTLAKGSLLMTFFRGLKYLLKPFHAATRDQENPFGQCVSNSCSCVLYCFEHFLQFLSHSVYMDVAVTSGNYCDSAGRALDTFELEVPAVTVLHGAQMVFQLGGTGVVTTVATFATIFTVQATPRFGDGGPQYVSSMLPVGLTAAILSFIISNTFMLVFDIVGETILFCFATEERRFLVVRQHNRQLRGPSVTDCLGRGVKSFGPSSWFGGEDEFRTNYAPPALRELLATRMDDLEDEDVMIQGHQFGFSAQQVPEYPAYVE